MSPLQIAHQIKILTSFKYLGIWVYPEMEEYLHYNLTPGGTCTARCGTDVPEHSSTRPRLPSSIPRAINLQILMKNTSTPWDTLLHAIGQKDVWSPLPALAHQLSSQHKEISIKDVPKWCRRFGGLMRPHA